MISLVEKLTSGGRWGEGGERGGEGGERVEEGR